MMISKSYKVLWVCFILMFTSTQFIIAQDFYVSDSNGSDNNSGTLEAPFKTINKGISMVALVGQSMLWMVFTKMKIMVM